MADTAHRKTDLKLEEMEKRLSAIYSRAEKEIQQTADEYFSKFAKQDEAKRKLLEQGKITEEEYTKWRKGKVMYGKRFAEMKEQCAKQLLNVNQAALAYVNGELPEVYAINYNALESAVDGVGGYSFTLVDADTVRNLAVTDTSLLPYKKIDPAKDTPWNMKKINAETLQGILQGESMDKIAKRIMNVQEMNKTQAIRSARTIVTGAENKGRQDSYARATADGIILQKEWISTNDSRTRHSHAVLDGAIVDQDKKFDNGLMYPGDPSGRPEEVYNCRCTVAAVVKGFKKAQVKNVITTRESFAEQLANQKLSPNSWEYDTFEEFWEARESFISSNGKESDFLDDVFAGKIDIGTGWVAGDGKHKIAQLENTIAELQKIYPLNPSKNLKYGTTIQKLRVCDYENAYMYLPDGRNDRRLVGGAIGQVFENGDTNAVIAFNRNWMYQTLEQAIEERSKAISFGKVLDSVNGSSPQTVAMHEWGHLMSNHIENAMINGESTAEEYWKWYQTLSKDEIRDGLSDYATTNRGEFEAECFAELMMPNPRPLALKYKEFLDKCIELGY